MSIQETRALIIPNQKNVDDYDKTCIETALHEVNQFVVSEWANNTACQIILVADGSNGVGPSNIYLQL